MNKFRTLIIAEAGVNHNGSLDMAMKLVTAAADSGVDVVKFQTFVTEACLIKTAEKADYQIANSGNRETQFEMVKKLELSWYDFDEIQNACKKAAVRFCSTPFDLTSVDYLRTSGLSLWKIPSGEITNLPYLRKIGSFGQEIILSTGMSELIEIVAALDVLQSAGTPRDKITVLHCNTEYPTQMEDVNLEAMNTLRDAFPGLKGVGYSDHTLGIEVPIAAVAMGASVIEKHFTLDRSLPGPDHQASLEPEELKAMVKAIRNIEVAMGNGIKQPTPSELRNKLVARKSIVASANISKGEKFTENNLAVKRPGTGMSPMLWDELIGQSAKKNYIKDDLIDA